MIDLMPLLQGLGAALAALYILLNVLRFAAWLVDRNRDEE